MTKLSQDELNQILTEHKLWLDAEGAKGSRANLRGANLIDADLRDVDLRYTSLNYANLRDADLSNSDLSYADLRNANLNCANLSNSDLNYTDLRNVNLSYANLISANLRGADLREANLSYANLISANLRGADLDYANLNCTDLSYADLRDAENIGRDKMSKLKDFDYERYLAGDKVVYEDGTPFEGEIFLSKIKKKQGYELPLIVILKSGIFDGYTEDGYVHRDKTFSEYNLKMAPKTKKLWIGVRTERATSDNWHNTTVAEDSEEKADRAIKRLCSCCRGDWQIVQIEIEE